VRWSWLVALAACGDNVDPRIVFIRGGSGTGGFVEGGTDDHLSDINDTTTDFYNRGYGELAALLRADGFVVEQLVEGPADANTPVDLDAIAGAAIVVFGSNNATYTADDAAQLARFVAAGGGALFISDGNWGTFWDKAPSSDQTFLTQFGLVMNQDGGGLNTIAGADFLVPDHPILRGVDAGFQGEGVSPCTLSHDPAALAEPVRLAIAKDVVHRNTAPDGPITPPTDDDASLVVVEYERGRVACHFDRNTFFNTNGAGSSLVSASNTTYAHNLFAWLAGR
jgi:hypothetical protein